MDDLRFRGQSTDRHRGDWYVIGPVTVTAISPKPLYGSEIPESELDDRDKDHPVEQRVRNGFMLNPPARMKVAYDSGVRNFFAPPLIQKPPVGLKTGDSLVSTISMPKGLVLKPQLRESIERGVDDSTPVRTARDGALRAHPTFNVEGWTGEPTLLHERGLDRSGSVPPPAEGRTAVGARRLL